MAELEAPAGSGKLAEVIATRGGRAEPEAPFVIEHREALIYMLCQAAELEHGIMCQYLFAAFSLKQHEDEGLTDEQLQAIDRWRRTILHVAADEMLHLALVHNVLSAIGSAPHLGRPNLPAPAGHYPAGVNLVLVPFGEEALRHFIFLERPEGMDLEGAKAIDIPLHEAVPLMGEHDIVPRLQDFATVGHLYRSIENGLSRLCDKFGERNLFIGPPEAQASSAHFGWSELRPVTDLASAQRAIDTILEQGEGARGHWKDAHFGQFVEILQEYRDIRERSPLFEPARRVVFATVRPSERDIAVPLITDRVAVRCVDLFNVSYEVLLLALERYFAHTEERGTQLKTLADAAVRVMVGVLAPLGQIITALPVGAARPGFNAGPSFELFYESDYLMPHLAAAWTMLEERLRQAANFARGIREIATPALAERVSRVESELKGIADMLAGHFPEWGARSRFLDGPDDVGKETPSALKIKEQADKLTLRATGTSPRRPLLSVIVQCHALAISMLATPAGTASSLVDGVLRPLVRACELEGDLPEDVAADADADADADEQAYCADLDSSLWQLAISVARLSGCAAKGDAAGWLKLAAAKLRQVADTLVAVAEEPTRAGRLASLDSMQPQGSPTITLVPNGPLIATDIALITDWLGAHQTPQRLRALCRCGRSEEKPDCDASCLRDGFDDGKDPNRVPDRRDTYRGEQVTIFDNRGICQHSGYCTDRLASVFHIDAEPFVRPSGARMDEIVNAVLACPSGALSYALGRSENRAHVDRDGTRQAAIEVTRDGPYRVTGGISLRDSAGRHVAGAQGASGEHYALCRCGHSQNKPYCSGMHWYVNFKDPLPAGAAVQTIYEAAGGMPALRRLTSLFYEKFVAGDPLLAPLYATIEPSEPERLAQELAWLTGAPSARPDYPGPLPATPPSTLPAEAWERWVELLCLAARQARLTESPELHATLRANLELYSRADGRAETDRFTWMRRPTAANEVREGGRDNTFELPATSKPIGFAEHIRPMFRESDRNSMRFAFDLWSYSDVSSHAIEIAARLADGTMPCDGAWPQRQIDAFNAWVTAGMPETAASS